MIKKYVSDLKEEFSGYNGKKFAKDLMAGVTVAAVALPLALAFGVSSGATPAAGLITAIVSGIVISLLGGAFYQISGPTGAMAAILMSLVAQHGMAGVFTATIMAGIILVLAGVFKLGKLTAFIPMPVIAGFTSGIAVIIALGQLDNFFGVKSVGDSAIEKLLSYFTKGVFTPDWAAVIIGAAVMVFMFVFPKKWNAVVPASLIAIIIATAVVMIGKLDVPSVSSIGAIPSSPILKERFSFSNFEISQVKDLISPAISIAALGMVESLLCGASAGRMTGVHLDNDRELVAQGIGNILSPLLGGIPATAAIARTSVAIKSGAQTRLVGIFHAIILLISMLVLGPVMSNIPLSALAGVLIVTAFRMNEWHTIKYMFSHKFKGAITKFLVTMIATIVFDLTVAILIGVLVALVLLVGRISKLHVKIENVEHERLEGREGIFDPVFENAKVAVLSGSVIFPNTNQVEDLAQWFEGASAAIISMRGVSYMDISGAQAFAELVEALQKKEVKVFFSGVSEDVMKMMERSDIVKTVGAENFYGRVDQVILK